MVARVCIFLLIIISGCSVLKKNPTKGNPPGTVQINDTLYVDQTEVANIHWQEYLYYLSNVEKNENKYQRALPDTTVWNVFGRRADTIITDTRSIITYVNNPLSEYYLRHPSYNAYPVVGISYEQAAEFCKWRTFVVNLSEYMIKNNFKDHREHLNDSFPIKVYYRLPTKDEWEMIAAGKLPISESSYGYKDVYVEWRGKKQRMFNCVFPGDKLKFPTADNEATYTADIKSFFPNSYHAYNMIGNVAEMVSEKGIAKGGSFVDNLDSCKITINKSYDGPQAWLGFRCVAIKVK